MACTWELFIAGEDEAYAQQVAWACWDEVERLERELSRFIPSSDVFQINTLQPGQNIIVGMAALECLALARAVHNETGGAFDVTIGALMSRENGRRDNSVSDLSEPPGAQLSLFDAAGEEAEEPDETPQSVGFHLLRLDEKHRTVGVQQAGVTVDLGAVGKGYALDQMASVLRDWGIENALMHSGQSSVLAMGAPPAAATQSTSDAPQHGWMVALRDPRDHSRMLGQVLLRDRALSGSGMELHGRHILDPRTGRPATGKLATWALARSAALSDALSTAFMVMQEDEVADCCRRRNDVAALLLLEGADGVGGAKDSVPTRLVGLGEFEGVVEAL